MPDLPAGHFVFLFTDIAGSIKLWEQHPHAMPSALARHDALVRHAVEASGGRVFKTVGDACYAVFGVAADALAAALAAQRALMAEDWDQLPLRVRVALHAGPAKERGGDYYGPTLNCVDRLVSAGHGGQILLTRAVLELKERAAWRARWATMCRPRHCWKRARPCVESRASQAER